MKDYVVVQKHQAKFFAQIQSLLISIKIKISFLN